MIKPPFALPNSFLKNLIKGRKITAVAQKLGMQQSYLSQILYGHRRIPKKKFDALLAILDIPSTQREEKIREYEEFLKSYKDIRKRQVPHYKAMRNTKMTQKYGTVYFRNTEDNFEIHLKSPKNDGFFFMVVLFDPNHEDPPTEIEFYKVETNGKKRELTSKKFEKLFPEFRDACVNPSMFVAFFSSSFGEHLGLGITQGKATFKNNKRYISLQLEDEINS